MDKTTFTYKINSINLKSGDPFTPGKINVFVGANNCGKTQILKDMLSYITGKAGNTIVLKELDIPYPDSWEEMEAAYNMRIIDTPQSKYLKHISPTLDGEPSGPSSLSLPQDINNWLKNNKRQFRA